MTLYLRQAVTALLAVVAFTVLLGVVYPVLVWGVGRVVASDKADGSYVSDASGKVVGSSLIGQTFTGEKWFQSRPSAAGNGYDAMNSSASNLSASNPDLLKAVRERQVAIAKQDGVSLSQAPADAVTSSGSGLDPDISPEYAAIQINRVARQNGLTVAQVQQLVSDNTQSRLLGFIGQVHVNVLQLNLALSTLAK